MENAATPSSPTPTDTPPADKPPLEERGHLSRTQLYIVSAILSLAVLGLVGYIVWDSYQIDSNSKISSKSTTLKITDSEDTAEGDTNSNTTEAYTGSYLTATLPSGWSLVELTDTSSETRAQESFEQGYSGFVGFIIRDEENHELFYSKPFPATGGIICDCSTYYQFPDDKPGRYEDTISMKEEYCSTTSSPTDNELELTEITEPYSEITIFPHPDYRRVATTLYTDPATYRAA